MPFKPRKYPSIIIITTEEDEEVVFVSGLSNTFSLPINSYSGIYLSRNGMSIQYPLNSILQIGFEQAVFKTSVLLDFNDY